MPASYRLINYSLRPAKSVERHMLCDAFLRLHPFAKVTDYGYVGLGSIYFSDFALFHRMLGIHKMLSIEKDSCNQSRFNFNKPYRCINMDYRSASDALPQVDWSRRLIVWLDYDSHLTQEVLSDICSVCTRISSGSALVVTVNATPDMDPSKMAQDDYRVKTGREYEINEYRLWMLQQRLEGNVPQDVTGKDLRLSGLAKVSHRIISNAVHSTMASRNIALDGLDKLSYAQLFNIQYSDGAQMLTTGGVFYSKREEDRYVSCGFDDLGFIRNADDPYIIKVPCLTFKEIRRLNELLPHCRLEEISVDGVTQDEIRQYAEIYRYFPIFTEALVP